MDTSQLPQHIFGMHDRGGENFFVEAGKRAWIVISAIATDTGADFSDLTNAGHGVIVRLNHGYKPDGTIPFSSQYDAFAQACANYVAGSRGAHLWIIGNETNLRVERPGFEDPTREEKITPKNYAQCFFQCRAAIRNVQGHGDDWVMPSPPGPWNNETAYTGNEAGDWVIYFRDLLNECIARGAPPDALALHTYTHNAPMDAGLIENEDRFADAPFQERHFQFRAYRDFLGVVPASLKTRAVFITESQALPWDDKNAGWIQKAYAEIDAWNAVAANQPIQALALFRWIANSGDHEQAGWSISDRRRLQDDLRAALQNEYRARWHGVPATTPAQPTTPTQPSTPTSPPTLLPLDKIRWFTEEAIRKLEVGDGKAASEILVNTVTPWFYASYPLHARELVNAEAHATARWHSEEATRQIEAGNLQEARKILLEHVLVWLISPGPRALGILSAEAKPAKAIAPKGMKRAKTKARGKKRFGVLEVAEAPPAELPVVMRPLREILLEQGDAQQILFFNRDAAIQKQIFVDGLVPNSAEIKIAVENVEYVAQRAEHLLTGEVRVYYAPTTNFNNVRFVIRDDAAAFNTPFKGGNRITQKFGEDPAYYQQFGFAGHEGVDLVPQDGNRDLYCIEDGIVLQDIDIPGDPKTNAYGIHVLVFNAANRRVWYYCHMAENRVQLKQQVKRGDVLGRMGGTGNTRGDHLHLNLKLLDVSSLPLTPKNGFRGLSDPLALLTALNAAQVSSALRDALLQKGDASQIVSFNTQAALQKQMFADGYCPNSAEFNVENNEGVFVAQRAENLNTGAVRVYYAPATNFGDVRFVEK